MVTAGALLSAPGAVTDFGRERVAARSRILDGGAAGFGYFVGHGFGVGRFPFSAMWLGWWAVCCRGARSLLLGCVGCVVGRRLVVWFG